MLEYGARYDQDNYFSTVIDKDNVTATTKGILDGEPVEFSGGSGGEEMFVINAERPELNTMSDITADKTFAEILEAKESGLIPVVKFMRESSMGGDVYAYANMESETVSSDNIVGINFTYESKATGTFYGYTFAFNSNGSKGKTYS